MINYPFLGNIFINYFRIMKLLEGKLGNNMLDLNRKKQIYKFLAIMLLAIDLISFSTMDVLDICFTLYSDEYTTKLTISIIKVY
jgi:hypothetical protein